MPWLVLAEYHDEAMDWNEDVHDHDDRGDVLGDEPVDDEEAEEDDEGHGEEDGAVVNIFAQSKLADQLKAYVVNSIIQPHVPFRYFL